MKNTTLAIKRLTIIALLIALNIVLTRFLSINLWNMRFGFSFLSIFLTAYLMGPVGSMVVAGVGDLLGALLFPSGPFFAGFTFSAVLTGLFWGITYKKCDFVRISVAVALSQLISSLLLNTTWISVLYNTNFSSVLVARLPQVAIMSVVEITVCTALASRFTALNRVKTFAG